MAAWNVLLVIAGLLLVALGGEAYFRLTTPFIENDRPSHFVDGVGLVWQPNAEVRFMNRHDENWVISRANGLGFLDREPVIADRAGGGCHIAFIGDSFVEAKEVPIADKFHVRLEEMAARHLPHLAITTQAYGIHRTGQINQIPFYDKYARRLNPRLVALVFYINDFADNSPALQSLARGVEPDRIPYMSVHRDIQGDKELRPADPGGWSRLPRPSNYWYERTWSHLTRVSYFAHWLQSTGVADIRFDERIRLETWANIIAERSCCTSLLRGWRPSNLYAIEEQFTEEHLPPVFEEALEYTALVWSSSSGARIATARGWRYWRRLMIWDCGASRSLSG